MIQVWRVEDAEGYGPYDSGVMYEINWKAVRYPDKNHKSPYEDGFSNAGVKAWMSGHFICGFRDLEQARAWFGPRQMKKLEAKGFRLKAMTATEVFYGDHQIIFKPAKETAPACSP